MKLTISHSITNAMYLALERSVAVYDLLVAHANGHTDLTEDQLANVVTRVSEEAKETLALARGRAVPGPRLSAYRAMLARRGGGRRTARGRARPRLDS